MSITKTKLSALLLLIFCLCNGAFAEPVELQLRNGELWQGETGSKISITFEKRGTVTKIEGTISRNSATFIVVSTLSGDNVIFVSNIISISTIEQGTSSTDKLVEKPQDEETIPNRDQQATSPKPTTTIATIGTLPKGVFLLPLDGGVGGVIRSTEIRQIAEHADEFGPGQIIVLDINSPGGSVLTGIQMRDLLFDIRKRHRVIAWDNMAISGGAFLSFCCDEIYFRSSANFGSITMWSGNFQAAAEPQMLRWIQELEGVLAKTSRTPLFAGPMVKVDRKLSYDKDSDTGEITYYDNLDGEVVLSNGTTDPVLSVWASQAYECGLSDGTADTTEQLAALLDLDEWVEIDDYGRKLAAEWEKTLKRAEEEVPNLFRKFAGGVDGPRIMQQIKAGEELISWGRRLGESAMSQGLGDGFMGSPNRIEAIKRQIEELKRNLR